MRASATGRIYASVYQTRQSFQSSPAREGECNLIALEPDATEDSLFQSSPAREGECNQRASSPLAPLFLFQSSPAREGECNAVMVPFCSICSVFQSSPAREGECNQSHQPSEVGVGDVSILTRP